MPPPKKLPAPDRVPNAVPEPSSISRPLGLALVAWFQASARDLPWRQNKDAYRIWVSEVMLQQTQVRTVIAYFHNFLDQFPTLKHLAEAPEERVLKAWEGLGYYRRARGLHQAAKLLVAKGHTNLPPDPELLATLPGMGDYTRNAVLSQAHGLPLPIVEANSQRVLSRVLGVKEDPAKGPVKKWLWQSAEDLVWQADPGAYNQALMELGALICTPQKPSCLVCPARPWCAAAATGDPESLPLKTPRPAITRVLEYCLALRVGSPPKTQWLLVRRSASASRWAGLWEFPHLEQVQGETHIQAKNRLVKALFPKCPPLKTQSAGTVRHAITRYQVEMAVEWASLESPVTPALSDHDASAWLTPDEIDHLPLSSPQRRVWKLLKGKGE